MYINSLKTFFPIKTSWASSTLFTSPWLYTPLISIFNPKHFNQRDPFWDLTPFFIPGILNPHLICLFATLTTENPALIHEILPLLRLNPLSSFLFCSLPPLNYPSQLYHSLYHRIQYFSPETYFFWFPPTPQEVLMIFSVDKPLAHAPDLF